MAVAGVQGAAADRGRKRCINSSAEVTGSCLQQPTPTSALITTSFLDIFHFF